MKAKFEIYETLSGKFEYLMSDSKGCNGFPKQFKTELQAIEAGSKINIPTKIIKSSSGKVFFLVKDTKKIQYLTELENRFGRINDFMNIINCN